MDQPTGFSMIHASIVIREFGHVFALPILTFDLSHPIWCDFYQHFIMDAIADQVFTDVPAAGEQNDDPSLLTIILDILPAGWAAIESQILLNEVVKCLLVFLNAHLSLNNLNLVAFLVLLPQGLKFLYPNPRKDWDADRLRDPLVSREMYRQFRVVDEAVLQELNQCFEDVMESPHNTHHLTLTGAVSMALTYTNRVLTVDQAITTTTASAISSTTKTTETATGWGSTSLRLRILVVTANNDDNIRYIPIMNLIFAAQRMKVPIDVVQLGSTDLPYLQQASDATLGVYLRLQDPQGLIQVLSTAYFVEPSIRPYIVLPTNTNVNYRALCFITGKLVDLGYVCSVCLCIMAMIPELQQCPACGSQFDPKIIAQLTRGPIVGKKKRKLAGGASVAASPTPGPSTPAPAT